MSSDLLNLSAINMVCWCIIYQTKDLWRSQVEVTKFDPERIFHISSEPVNLLCLSAFMLVMLVTSLQHMECPVKSLGCYFEGQGHRVQILKNICLSRIVCTVDHFCPKLGILVFHYWTKWPVQRQVAVIKAKVMGFESLHKCLSITYFLNIWNFSNQTWDAQRL